MNNFSSYPMLASMSTTLMLSIIFLMLSRQSNKMYMKIWGYSWLVCSIIFFVDFFNLAFKMNLVAYIMLRQLLSLMGAYLFLMGTYRFFQLKLPNYFSMAVLISTIVILIYPVSDTVFTLFLIPNVILCSGMLIVSGCLFITASWTQKLPEKMAASFLILCWSIFINHFGFTLNNSSMATVTYYLGLFTVNVLMLTLIIIYFKKLRFIDNRLSSRFRLLVENSSDSMFLYDYKKQDFEYISDSIADLIGLSPKQLYEIPERFFEHVNIEEKNRDIINIFSRPIASAGSGVLCLYKNGAIEKWAEIHYLPIRDNTGIVTAVEGILRDITERKKMEKELDEAAEAKKELIENISHEIKTPITLIKGYSESLLDNVVPEESTETYLHMINSKAMMLSTLMDDLSHVSDLSSQSMEYKFYEKPASDIFNDLLKQAELHIISSNHEPRIVSDIAPNAVLISDPYRIQQVITNMINNAARHTPYGQEILVSCITKPNEKLEGKGDEFHDIPEGELIFTVSDRGDGISEEDLPHIFERKFSAGKRLETSTGLGLHISKQIITQHSGRMSACNNKYGGAEISFSLPYYA